MNICGKASATNNAPVSRQRFGKFGDLRYAQGRDFFEFKNVSGGDLRRGNDAAKVSGSFGSAASLSHVPNQI
jgi:hypothetical protein